MSVTVAEKELSSITKFQEQLNIVKDEDGGQEDIISNFYQDFLRSRWHSSIPVKFKSVVNKDGTISYPINKELDLLLYSFLYWNTPEVVVKEKYKGKVRICWTHNLANNHIEYCHLTIDGKKCQHFDSVDFDIIDQFLSKNGPGKRKNHRVNQGNVSILEEWSEFLPSLPIIKNGEWFYSIHPTMAFPIFYRGKNLKAYHQYSFVKSPYDLLRVQKLDEKEEWINVDPKLFDEFLTIKNLEGFKEPELWGRYVKLTKDEIEWWKKCNDSKKYYIRDFVDCDVPEIKKYGQEAIASLDSKRASIAVFWLPENIDSRKNHSYSNYTTNTEDLFSGWDPIKNNSLYYGDDEDSYRFKNAPSVLFSRVEPFFDHFPSCPEEIGYHGHGIASRTTNLDGDISLSLKQLEAKFSCTLADTNPFLRNEDNIQSPEFKIHVRLYTLKKFSVKQNEFDEYIFALE